MQQVTVHRANTPSLIEASPVATMPELDIDIDNLQIPGSFNAYEKNKQWDDAYPSTTSTALVPYRKTEYDFTPLADDLGKVVVLGASMAGTALEYGICGAGTVFGYGAKGAVEGIKGTASYVARRGAEAVRKLRSSSKSSSSRSSDEHDAREASHAKLQRIVDELRERFGIEVLSEYGPHLDADEADVVRAVFNNFDETLWTVLPGFIDEMGRRGQESSSNIYEKLAKYGAVAFLGGTVGSDVLGTISDTLRTVASIIRMAIRESLAHSTDGWAGTGRDIASAFGQTVSKAGRVV